MQQETILHVDDAMPLLAIKKLERSSELRSSGVQNVFQMGIQTPPEREPLNQVEWELETQE
jgi:hypothetical protein